MARTSLYPPGLYLSPSFVMDRLEVLFKRCGTRHVLQKSKFKPEREAWIVAAFLLGLIKENRKEYWISINPEDTPPDIYVASFISQAGKKIRQRMYIEVFEWEGHNTRSLLDAILEKLRNLALPKNYILLCHVRDHPGETFNAEELFKNLEPLKLSINEIWVVGSIQSFFHNFAIARVFPKRYSRPFVLEEERKYCRLFQSEMFEASRGAGNKTPILIPKHLPLPEC